MRGELNAVDAVCCPVIFLSVGRSVARSGPVDTLIHLLSVDCSVARSLVEIVSGSGPWPYLLLGRYIRACVCEGGGCYFLFRANRGLLEDCAKQKAR